MSFHRIFLVSLLIFFLFSSIYAATHDELPQCGVTGVYKTRQSVLQTPNYPDNYPPNTCYDYVIRSPFRCPTKFHIQFLDFHLESSSNCTNDYLAIGLENDGDDMDILCGQVVGIKKYHTPDGVLRLRFYADDSPWTTAKGFKLLVTRLACERASLLRDNLDSSDDDSEVVNAAQPQLLPTTPSTILDSKKNNSFLEQHVPYPLHPLFGLNYPNPPFPTGLNGFYPPPQQTAPQQSPSNPNREKPCTPTQPQLGYFPQFYLNPNKGLQQELPLIQDQYVSWSSTGPAQTRQQIGSHYPATATEACCATSFAQKHFYLSSPGFPRTAFTSLLPTQQRDCQFELEKSSHNVCRLRMHFKFFDFGQVYSSTGSKEGNIEVAIGTSKDICTEDYLEIDGERFCGCRSGYVYTTYWGSGKKLLRMRTGYAGIPTSGFLLEISQEECSETQLVQQQLSGMQNIGMLPSAGLANAFLGNGQNIGLPANGIQQGNGFANFAQQQNSLNPSAFNGQQGFIGTQQAGLLPQQLLPFYQQTPPQYIPQNTIAPNQPIWTLPQQQPPMAYPVPQFRSSRNIEYAKSESHHQPITVVETNSTRKEYYYNDGEEIFARSRISDEPDDPETQVVATVRGRCKFDAMDALRLSVDYQWLTKPTCYSPQGRWFSNFFG